MAGGVVLALALIFGWTRLEDAERSGSQPHRTETRQGGDDNPPRPPVSTARTQETVDTPRVAELKGVEAAPVQEPLPEADEEPGTEATGPTTLRVVVVPYGEVWLDGRRVGTSPVTLRVPPGRHVVGTGEGAPSRTRPVRIAAGQHRQVEFR